MDRNTLSLRKLATILGVSQPFLSQIRAGKRPLPDALKRKVEALGAYHLLITGGRGDITPGDAGAGPGVVVGTNQVVGVGRIELPTSCSQSRGLNPLQFDLVPDTKRP